MPEAICQKEEKSEKGFGKKEEQRYNTKESPQQLRKVKS